MKTTKKLLLALAVSGLVSTSSFADAALVAKGEKIFKTKKLGNCVACHDVNGKDNIKAMGPGSFGKKLSALKYYPDDLLYNIIYDPYTTLKKPITQMPAFGKSGWLDDAEIKALVAYLKTVE
jgi:sulfur-oxidizing protein SoxX